MCLLAGAVAVPLFAADLPWITSLPDAQAQAKKENKLVLIDFTGSDWCESCKELDLEVFDKPQFAKFAKTNLVLVQVDMPIAKKQSAELEAANQALTNRFKVRGFPTLFVLDPGGMAVWTNEGVPDGGLKDVLSKLKKLKKDIKS